MKASYALREARRPQDPAVTHHCHWPGCDRSVAPSLWGCAKHWGMLPRTIRARIWASFRPGQEHDKRPSPTYVAAAREAELFALAANDVAQPQRSLL